MMKITNQEQQKTMAKKQIELTEQDLHALVEDAVCTYLKEERIDEFWGGMNNVMRGISNGNWQMSQNYRSGQWASSFNSYYKSAEKAVRGMLKIVNSNEATQGYAQYLQNILTYLGNINQMYSKFAVQQSGNKNANNEFHYDDDGGKNDFDSKLRYTKAGFNSSTNPLQLTAHS